MYLGSSQCLGYVHTDVEYWTAPNNFGVIGLGSFEHMGLGPSHNIPTHYFGLALYFIYFLLPSDGVIQMSPEDKKNKSHH
ncbi:hypothetical protein DVH24_032155 [Malus domestica]|uniref:Uncharacterized protein n=1 Tax=Malus domestica TaxID=3750 RepID=A0A498J2M2_MALDO|nr:hypothetical protein DVH24_032155 [Malus domestica]